MPPVPKPASVRRGHRSNSPRRVLEAVINPTIPDLPGYCDWHPAVIDFWSSAWASELPQEWIDFDRNNILLACRALQAAWDPETSPTARSAAMAEYRLIMRECGLTPMARRSLQIEIARAESATEQRAARKAVPKVAAKDDPRRAIRPA